MKKKLMTAAIAAVAVMSFSMVSFAASWQNNNQGWWYQNDDGTYPQNVWQWIDGNGDGKAESYYFDSNGYLLTNTTTPDGYTVNGDGAWVSDGALQQKQIAQNPAQSQDAKQVFLDSSKKTSEFGSMEADANMDLTISAGGETIGMKMNMNMKYKDLNTANMKFLSTIKMSLLGQEMNGTIFYTDGYYYADMNGEKAKSAMDMSAMISQINKSTNMANVDYSYMKDFQMTTDGNGDRVITFNIDSNALLNQVNQIYKTIGMDMSNYQISFDNMSGSATITPDGYCKAQKINMTMNMNVEGQAATASVIMDLQYKNPGQPVDFTLPSTDGYVETTPQQ